MALIIRVDVDRPYGREPLPRHLLSRFASDYWLPRLPMVGYLAESMRLVELFDAHGARAHFFFRRCTRPHSALLAALNRTGHNIGLHLEDSRSYETFTAEVQQLQKWIDRPVRTMSKHGSGGRKFGWHHHPPYEAERYIDWSAKAGLAAFMGNLEDPTIPGHFMPPGLAVFPSAFWLEPAWRDTARFSVDWLMETAAKRDVVILIHPENVFASSELVRSLESVLRRLPSRLVDGSEGGQG